MKCHSVRVNLRGSEDNLYNWKQNSIENLNKLCEYAKPLNINIIVENHGDFSSNADHLIDVIENVNQQNVGTLPDFGNFCVKQHPEKYGEASRMFTMGAESKSDRPPFMIHVNRDMICMIYANMQKVNAKTDLMINGNDVDIDYKKMLQIVKETEYQGFIGVEAQAFTVDPIEAIIASKKLLVNSYS